MLYMSCRDDRQLLGKKEMIPEKVDIEMQSKEKKVEVESGDNATSPTVVVPCGDVSGEVSSEVVHMDKALESVQTVQSDPVQTVQSDPVQTTQSTESTPIQLSEPLPSTSTPVVSLL